MSEENKRLLAIFGVVIVIVIIILIICFWPEKNTNFSCDVKADGDYEYLGAVDYEEYACLMESDETVALVVADSLSDDTKSNINDVATSLGKAIYYVDTEEVSDTELEYIKSDLDYTDESFEEDVILVVEDGEVTSYKEDILSDYDELSSFLEDAGLAKFACGVSSDSEYENLGEITYEDYECLYESDDTFVLILAQTTCSYCDAFKPIIDEYALDNDIPVYIAEIDEFDDDDLTDLLGSLSYFDDNESWGTPLTLAIKDKEVINEISGYTDDTSALDDFFEEIGLK